MVVEAGPVQGPAPEWLAETRTTSLYLHGRALAAVEKARSLGARLAAGQASRQVRVVDRPLEGWQSQQVGESSAWLIDQSFGVADLGRLRHRVSTHALALGLPEDRAAGLELIASELMINAIEHGGGQGRLRLWTADGSIQCQVSDAGPGIAAGAVTQAQPVPEIAGVRGRGLWLARTLADSLTIGNAAAGGAIATVTIFLPDDRPAA